MIPKTIHITTDNTVLEYIETIVKDSRGVKLPTPIHNFQYTKSKEKKGLILPLTDKGIVELMNNQKLFE